MSYKLLLLLALSTYFSGYAQGSPTGLTKDSLALVDLQNSTNGPEWTIRWDLNQPLNTWHGITITQRRVTAVNLKANNLTGAISDQLKNLDSLITLNLEANQITRLPNLTDMTKLDSLDVADNYLTLADLKPNASKFSHADNYSPQIVRTGKRYHLNHGQNLSLQVDVPRVRHTYQWFHNNLIMRTQVSPTLTLANIQAVDSGFYHCQIIVNDDVLVDLELFSQPDTLNLNLSPTDLHLSKSKLPENQPLGSVIGQFTTVTADADSFHTYHISGPDAAKFTLAKDTLKSAAIFDYETEKLYRITITTTDTGGLSLTKDFDIRITNVNESPIDLLLSDSIILENSPAGTLIGRLNTQDTDTRDVHIYTLTGGDIHPFAVFTNRLEVANPMDFESQQTYQITITTQDWDGLSYSKNFTIRVGDINEAPQTLTLSNNTINENEPIATTIGSLNSHDQDRDDTQTYTLTGLDTAAFFITGNVLKSKSSFDFETQSQYQIEITVTDRGRLTKTETFDIDIKNVIEYTAGTRLKDSLALVALYNHTDGANWIHTWDFNQPLETWHGVTIFDKRVVKLHLNSNNLVGPLPQMTTDIANLRVCNLADNKLTALADLSTLSLDTLKVAANSLTFKDLKPNIAFFHHSSNYSPQNKFGLAQTYHGSDSQAVTLPTNLTDSTNQYQWYRYDSLLSGETKQTLHIDQVFFNINDGAYHSKVTNPAVPHLTLVSNIHTVIFQKQVLESDSLALAALYDSAGGPNWNRKWDLSKPIHTWHGVTVKGNRVTRLELVDNNLQGPMPDQMANLTLELINVNDNYLDRLVLPETDSAFIKNNRFNLEDITKYWGPAIKYSRTWFHQSCYPWYAWWEYGQTYRTRRYDMYTQLSYCAPQREIEHGKYYRVQRGDDFVLRAPEVKGANLYSWKYGRYYPVYAYFKGGHLRGILHDDAWGKPVSIYSSITADTLVIDSVQIKHQQIYRTEIENHQYYKYYSKRNDPCTGRKAIDYDDAWTNPFLYPITFDTLIVETVAPAEFDILMELYHATNGADWIEPWDTLEAVRDWFGVELNQNLDRVIGLRLPFNNLDGIIPPSLAALDSLKTLDLGGNKLRQFPDLTGLNLLQDLKIQENELGFDDVRANLRRFNGRVAHYSPQRLRAGKRYGTAVGDTLSLGVGLTGPSYNYRWFQHDTLALSHGADTLILKDLAVEDGGLYHCEVRTPSVPGLVLRSGFDTLIIQTVVESDSLALVALYDSTAGWGWRHRWDFSRPANTWYGLTIKRGRVRSIQLHDNNLRGLIPPQVHTLELTTFDVGQNQLHGLNLPTGGATLKLTHNNLDFGDLIPYSAHFDSVAVYAPQNSVRAGELYEQNYNDSLMLTVAVGGDGNRYQWFHNKALVTGATAANLVIPNVQNEQIGHYYCQITNPALPGLVLESGWDTLIIAPREIDSLALVALWTAAQGPKWKHSWDLTQPLTTWAGLTLTAGRVTEIDLSNNNLVGRVPEDLKYLDRLTKLHLQNNHLASLDSLGLAASLDFQVQNNRLTIKDLAPNLGLFRNTAAYSPQIIRDGAFYKEAVGAAFELSVQVAEAAPTYQWFLDRTALTGETAARFSLDSIIVLDVGNYHCEVVHSALPTLKRISLPDTLTIFARSLDSLALVALYRATDGPNWRVSWNLNQPIHTWYGVRMKDGRVHELRLFSNRLTGSLPLEIGYLEKLTILEISDNRLTGAIPSTLGRLRYLHTLNLFDNQFSDSLPPEIGNLENLMILDIADNKLTGDLPASLGNLKNLTTFYFMNNAFTGAIPPEIGRLVRLLRVDGENNELTGTIPPEIGNLIHLETLYLCNNKLTGAIPPEVGRLTKLQILYLCENDFSDSIPAALGNLINLVKLNLAGNNLEGSLPESIGNLEDLTHLWLQDNGLDSIPDLSGLTNLVSIKIKNNRLDFEDVAQVISQTGITPDPGEDLTMSIRTGRHYVRPYDGLLLLTVNIRGAGNIYQWFHDEVALDGETSSTLSVGDIRVADAGLYHCQVTNARVRDMTLSSLPDTLEILPLSLDSLRLVALQANLGKPLWDLNQPLRAWSRAQIKHGRVTGLNLENVNFESYKLEVINSLDALDSLDLSSNGFKFSPDLRPFKHLKFLDLSNNALRQLDVSIRHLDSLETLWVFDNKLSILPDFSHLARLQNLMVQVNYLGFEDIRLNLGVLNHNANNYSPQFIEFPGRVYRQLPASELNLKVNVAAAQAYQWFHNGTALVGEEAKAFKRSGLALQDAGVYRCDITHTGVPQLTLQTFDTLIVTRTVTESDSLALISFYNHTSGAFWKTPWNLYEPVYKWHGLASTKGRVTKIQLDSNQIEGIIPETILRLDSLKSLEVSSNKVYGLPDLSSTNLVKLNVANNYLDFVDLRPNMSFFHSSAEYSPQKTLPNGRVHHVERGAFLRLTARIRNKDNIYQWFHDGRLLKHETNRLLNLPNIQKADEGGYYCKVQNVDVPGLTLTTHPDQVVVPRTVIRSDSLALVAFYNSTAGKEWHIGWDLETPVASWLGLIIDKPAGRVTHMIFEDNNLAGFITDSLRLLDALVYLDLSGNKLVGSIPASMLALKNLTVLDLSKNEFSYKIPADIDRLENLTELHLDGNDLSGSIPSSLTQLKNLQVIRLSNNRLEGPLPLNLRALNQLEKLDLSHNKLTGALPSSLGSLTNLVELDFASNRFSGPIPTTLQQLRQLEYLDLRTNHLSGSIPSQLGSLVNLKYLDLGSNFLTDSIPFNFIQLTHLEVLRLDHNQLKDAPDMGSHLPALTDLQLAYNYLGIDDLKTQLNQI